MNIYVDESGSIAYKPGYNYHFVIAFVRVFEPQRLQQAHDDFVSKYTGELKALDEGHGKMFKNGKFAELKGNRMDKDMKLKFLKHFTTENYFDIFYISFDTEKLNPYCYKRPLLTFNYSVRLAMEHFIAEGLLPHENCHLQLDNRNEKSDMLGFLQNYLNAELTMSGFFDGEFRVTYFDSTKNRLVQIADVFSNMFYLQMSTHAFDKEFNDLMKRGIIKCIFPFPVRHHTHDFTHDANFAI